MPTGTVQEDLCLLLWPDVGLLCGWILSLYLFKSLSHSYCRPIFMFALLVFLSGCRWSVHRQSLLPATDHRPLYHPPGTPGPLLWLLEAVAAACWIFALHLLPVQTVGHTDLYVWSAPVGGNREKTGVKGSFDQASRDARSSSFSYFFSFFSFFLAWDGHFRGDLTFTRSNTGIVRGRFGGTRLGSSLLKQYTRTPPFFRATWLTSVLTWDDVNVPRGVRPHTALQ